MGRILSYTGTDMIKWTFCFILGIDQPHKTGKREVATWITVFWCWAAWRVGVNEAANTPMPITADLLRMASIFVFGVLAAAFGFDQLIKAGWLQKGSQGRGEAPTTPVRPTKPTPPPPGPPPVLDEGD